MSFSTGQLVFIISFFILFLIGMIYSYRRDKSVTRTHYRGAYKVLIALVVIFVALYALMRSLS